MPDVYKIINATKEDACRQYEADQIRLKTGESAQLNYDFENGKGLGDYIAAIPSGGGLPSSISKIDGGSFTFASDTTVTAQILHNLGVVPRGAIVWTEENDMLPRFYGGGLIRFNSTGIADGAYRIIVYRSGASVTGNSTVQSSYATILTTTFWSINHGSYQYQAGKEYKWIAWA